MKLKKGEVDDIHCVTECIAAVGAYVSIRMLTYACSRGIAAVTVANCIC